MDGVNVDWGPLFDERSAKDVTLPTYAFQREPLTGCPRQGRERPMRLLAWAVLRGASAAWAPRCTSQASRDEG